MVKHYDKKGATPAWLLMSANLQTDDGHCIEFRDGRVILDGVASLSSYASARELMADAA